MPSLVKCYLTATRHGKIHQKFICRKIRSSFEGIDFFTDEPNSLRNIHIFKKNSAMYGEKSILQNLMSSTPLRLPSRVIPSGVAGRRLRRDCTCRNYFQSTSRARILLNGRILTFFVLSRALPRQIPHLRANIF